MRGQVFEIDGKKVFTFGGARSHDIEGGILELKDPEFKQNRRQLERDMISYRINHLNWWKEELPSDEEMETGRKNLLKHDYKVDFIVSHCCSTSTQTLFAQGVYQRNYLNDYFEEIRNKTEFKKWFFGHYHDNLNVSAKEILIYEQIIRIS